MLRVSHRLVLVDEYQDCLIDQHNLVLALREAVPTAVFGDPLQRLFNFGHNRPVSWTTDVLTAFPHVGVASYPWRWHVDNPELGEWLVSIRQQLLAGQSIGGLDEKKTAEFLALSGQASGPVVAAATVQFAVDCATGVATHFPSATRQRLRSGSQIGTSNDALRPVFGSVNALLSAPTPGAAHRALLAISRLPDVRLYCREAWREVLDAMRRPNLI
jgi:hypothetical protein